MTDYKEREANDYLIYLDECTNIEEIKDQFDIDCDKYHEDKDDYGFMNEWEEKKIYELSGCQVKEIDASNKREAIYWYNSPKEAKKEFNRLCKL